MNVGYGYNNNLIYNEKCPICGNNIYVSKYYNDYACVNIDCPLGHGAKDLIKRINRLLGGKNVIKIKQTVRNFSF